MACSKNENVPETILPPELPEAVPEIVQLPIVVHIIHNGEAIGEGPNISLGRVLRQIEILNADFRRKEGTRGFNDHPNGADSKIEFVLARFDPNNKPINGINRINTQEHNVKELGYNQNHFAQYAYWNPEEYINVWVTPLPLSTQCIVLGTSTGPLTDLPGTELLSVPQEGDAEGILINWSHFGKSEIDCQARFGRTLTHEMGHYFGLLHPWGRKDCDFNDHCDDTPAVDVEVFGRVSFMGCSGENVMIGNYMNFSDDDVMNIFTKDQVARMRYVLENHDGRKSLISSPAL